MPLMSPEPPPISSDRFWQFPIISAFGRHLAHFATSLQPQFGTAQHLRENLLIEFSISEHIGKPAHQKSRGHVSNRFGIMRHGISDIREGHVIAALVRIWIFLCWTFAFASPVLLLEQ